VEPLEVVEQIRPRLVAVADGALPCDLAIGRFRQQRAGERPVDPAVKRRKELEAEVTNLVDAIGKGLLSPTLARRLQDAEAELAALPSPCLPWSGSMRS
jgi:hypothetical protein